MAEDDDAQLCKAHERIRELNSELLMQGDASAEIAALRKKIALSKERAQGIVNMAHKRLAYLHELWSETPQKEPKKDDKSDSLRSPIKSEGEPIDYRNYRAVLSRAIATLDNISLSTPFTESKKESARLAKDLRDFVVNLQLAEKNLAKTNEASSSLPSTSQATSTMTTGNTTATSLLQSSVKPPNGGNTETASTKTAPVPATSAARSTLMITAKSASPSAQAHTAKPESSAPTPASLTKTALPTTPPPVISTNAAPPTTPPPVSSTKTALQKPPSPQTSKQLPTPIPQATPGQTKPSEQPKTDSKQEPILK